MAFGAKLTPLDLQYNTLGVANGKFHDSPDVGQKVLNSVEMKRNTLKRRNPSKTLPTFGYRMTIISTIQHRVQHPLVSVLLAYRYRECR